MDLDFGGENKMNLKKSIYFVILGVLISQVCMAGDYDHLYTDTLANGRFLLEDKITDKEKEYYVIGLLDALIVFNVMADSGMTSEDVFDYLMQYYENNPKKRNVSIMVVLIMNFVDEKGKKMFGELYGINI